MITLPPALAEMAASPRWLLWDRLDNRKVPFGTNAQWGLTAAKRDTFDAVLAQWNLTPCAFDGVGYVPDLDDPYACLDFDKLNSASQDALNLWHGCRQTTYCEYSPSGNGAHALIKLDARVKARLRGVRNIIPGLELYSDSGFFTVTGQVIDARPIHDYSDRLWNLAERLNLQSPNPRVQILLTGRMVMPLERNRILAKISKWKNAEIFNALMSDWNKVKAWTGGRDNSFRPSKNHGGVDRSMAMIRLVGYLVAAKARDPDLIWSIVKDSLTWREFQRREYSRSTTPERALFEWLIPNVLAEIPPPPPLGTQNAIPSFMKGATPK